LRRNLKPMRNDKYTISHLRPLFGQANPYAGDLTVYFSLGGTLVYGRDFALIPQPDFENGVFSVDIPSGQASVTVTVAVTAGAVPASHLMITLAPYGSVQ
jgi:hypothetical protein